MDPSPTLLQRLAALEGDVAWLMKQQSATAAPTPSRQGRARRSIPRWTGGSLLLAQLQRRHPEALHAYEQPAALGKEKNGQIRLAIDKAEAPFVFVATPPDGDALLYPAAAAPDWLMEGAFIRDLFALPDAAHELPLQLERPARFIAARQGEEWVFHGKGEFLPTLAPRSQGEGDRRQQRLWEEWSRQKGRQASELRALQEKVASLERSVQQLCRLQAAVAETTPQE